MAQKKVEVIGRTFVDGEPVDGTPAKPVLMSVSEEDFSSLICAGMGRAPVAKVSAKKEAA